MEDGTQPAGCQAGQKLKELEAENKRLKKILADQVLSMEILQEAFVLNPDDLLFGIKLFLHFHLSVSGLF